MADTESLRQQWPRTRAERFEIFKERCSRNRMKPPDFRKFCEMEDEYEREWEVATHEWNNDVAQH